MNTKCPSCGKEIDLKDNFCPMCGYKFLDRDKSLSKGNRIKIYVLSVLLAPFGLYWFFKFFRDKDPEKKRVAFISLYITIVMLILLVVVNMYFVKALNVYVNSYNFAY